MSNRNEDACSVFSKTLGIVAATESRIVDGQTVVEEVNKTTDGPRVAPVYGAFLKEFEAFKALGGLSMKAFATFLTRSAKTLMATTTSDTGVKLAHLRKAKLLLEMSELLLKEASEQAKEADLNAKANLTTNVRSKSQKTNRNAAPNGPGPSDAETLMAAGKAQRGETARHSRYCKSASGSDIQGRNCSVCHGVGFSAHARIQAAKAQGDSLNKSRELQASY